MLDLDDLELAAALRLIAHRILYELLLVGASGEAEIVWAAADRLENKHMALVGPDGEQHSSMRHPAREGMTAAPVFVPRPIAPGVLHTAVAPRKPDRGRFVGPDLTRWQPGQPLPVPPAPVKGIAPSPAEPATGIPAAAAMRSAVDPGLQRLLLRALAQFMAEATLTGEECKVLAQAMHVVSCQ